MFEGFSVHELTTERGAIHARVGGSGPPLLLLHGYPETHLMWHAAAPLLADRFTVVATDLAGYGDRCDRLRPPTTRRIASARSRSTRHWGFLAQPAPLPERLIAGDPDAYFEYHLRSIGLGREPGRYPDSVIAAYRAQLSNTSAVEAIWGAGRAWPRGRGVALPGRGPPRRGRVGTRGFLRERQRLERLRAALNSAAVSGSM